MKIRSIFFIGAFYDGVYLLGLALNETLTEGGNIRDGYRLTRKMWNRDFLGLIFNASFLSLFFSSFLAVKSL